MFKNNDGDHEPPNSFQENFLAALIQDVILSTQRLDAEDSQSNRREFVRTSFAAIEGFVWNYRENVRSFCHSIADLSPLTIAALSEESYSVTGSGVVVRQVRYIPLPSMFRLTTRLAEEYCPGLKVNFSTAGWSSFNKAIKIRNRVTHPKKMADLEIAKSDVQVFKVGFFWLFDTIFDVSETTNVRLREYLADLQSIVSALYAGDPETLALYERARLTLNPAAK